MEQLSDAYGIRILRCHALSQRDHVHDSGTFLVDTSNGRLILREHVRNTDEKSLLYEYSILMHLRDHHYSAPEPLLHRSGTSFLSIGGKHYVFFNFIPGYVYTQYFWTKKDKLKYIYEAGKALGQFHELTDGFRPKGLKSWLDDGAADDTFKAVHRLVQEKTTPDDFDQFFIGHYGFLTETRARMVESLKNGTPITKGIVHEDFGPYNLLFHRQGLRGVIDWMDAHEDARAKDLIFALLTFTRTRKGPYEETFVRAFIKGYQIFIHVSSEDIEHMVDLLTLKRIDEMPSYLVAHYLESDQNPKYASMFTGFMREIAWHQKHKTWLVHKLKETMR